MFNVGTILERKTPQGDLYDEVRIVGVNPLKTPQTEEWAAAGNPGILLTPNKDFGETRPISFKLLSEHYRIKEEANGMPITQTSIDGVQESPEAQFARQAQAATEAAQQAATEAAQPAEATPAKTSKASTAASVKDA